MDVRNRCAALKGRVETELRRALDGGERVAVLISALYELSRVVIPALGRPQKSREYLDDQAEVLELISFIAILLIRSSGTDNRGVAVLTEIGEGCLDPLLKKKLSVYAQELLTKSRSGGEAKPRRGKSAKAWAVFGLGTVALCGLYFAPRGMTLPREKGPEQAEVAGPAPEVQEEQVAPPPAQVLALPPAQTGPARDRTEPAPPAVQQGTDGKTAHPEQVTKVRITENQVLVPVTLRNGSETVKVELVLDTGATRTAIHESIATRLRIDLRQAKVTVAELADGRTLSSHVAPVDSLMVGPFTMASAALDFIPFKGAVRLHDGLLGMDFLGKHRYQIDMERELIRWF